MRKVITIFLIIAAVSTTIAIAAGLAGSKNDPLVSLSYLNGTFMSSLKDNAISSVKNALDIAEKNTESKLQEVKVEIPNTSDEIAAYVAETVSAGSDMVAVTVSGGSTITMQTGTQFFFLSGTGVFSQGNAINLTKGTEVSGAIVLNNTYLVPEDMTIVLNVTSSSCIYIGGIYNVSSETGREVVYTSYADALNSLGLFNGTNNGYELERRATRIEGIVMLIRLLGEENDALSYTGEHPFNDVSAWAKKYVAYAYHKGYTKGSSKTTFGSNDIMTGNQYMTFILRALSYDDSMGDFVWNKAVVKSETLGIITSEDRALINTSRYFYRDHIAYTSYKALLGLVKNQNTSLSDKLVLKGVITKTQFENVEKIFS